MGEVLSFLKKDRDDKVRRGVAPTHTSYIELRAGIVNPDLNKALNQLFKDGKIRAGLLLNGKYIELVDRDGSR